MTFRAFLLAGAAGFAALSAAGAALAQTAPTDRPDDAYDLGELVVTARDRDGQIVGGAVIRSDDMRRFDKASVDQALDLIPGAAAGSSGGSRPRCLHRSPPSGRGSGVGPPRRARGLPAARACGHDRGASQRRSRAGPGRVARLRPR